MDFKRVQNGVSQMISANFDGFAQLRLSPVGMGQSCGGHTRLHLPRWVPSRRVLVVPNGCCFLGINNILDAGLCGAVEFLIAISDSPPFPVDYISMLGL